MKNKNYTQDGGEMQNYHPKISIITVVFNNAEGMRRTANSVFSQTWDNKEYIVIDGGSTDGTKDVIYGFEENLSYWCSEGDAGIYDAMNKGIAHACGDWICFLNSGDVFSFENSLESAITSTDTAGVDVIYGNSIEMSSTTSKKIESVSYISKMKYYPTYRHGSSLVRTEIQKKFLFDLSKQRRLHYALDWEMIFRMFKSGCTFKKVDVFIESYELDGVSNHPFKNRWYNYLITSSFRFNLFKLLYFVHSCTLHVILNSSLYAFIRAFFLEFILNDIIPLVPFWSWRKAYFKLVKMKIEKGSFVMKSVYIQSPNKLSIGEYSHINRGCTLDARAGLTIGNSVSISHQVNIMTGSHDYRSESFQGVFKPIEIQDHVWLGVGCTILQGVRIGKGAVVCAGAVVNKNVDDYDVVAGVPAKPITKRPKNLDYRCRWETPLT